MLRKRAAVFLVLSIACSGCGRATVAGLPPSSPAQDGSDAAGGSPGGRAALSAIALWEKGVPYVWGGETPDGADCSGFVMLAYRGSEPSGAQPMPHGPDLREFGTEVSIGELLPGDLAFRPGHVGILVEGSGERSLDVIDNPGVGKRTRRAPLRTEKWSQGFRRPYP